MKLVCLGDSLTYGFKLPRNQTWPYLVGEKYNIEVLNKGINGDTTSGMLGRFYFDVVGQKATHVIIMGGGNDMIWKVPSAVTRANTAALVQQAYYNGIVPIIGITIPIELELAKKHWSFIDGFSEVNGGLKEYRDWVFFFSRNFKCGYIDFYGLFTDADTGLPRNRLYIDGLHPTIEGNILMAEAVEL